MIVLAACADIPQSRTAKVCVTDRQGAGSRVWVTEFSKEATISEVVGYSRECRNPNLPILAIAKD